MRGCGAGEEGRGARQEGTSINDWAGLEMAQRPSGGGTQKLTREGITSLWKGSNFL